MSGKTISTILRHDNKQNSYKIALLRAINDVVMNFPDAADQHRDIAIPLKLLADYWIAYYWSFVDVNYQVYQGPRSNRNGVLSNDISFRPELTELRKKWLDLNPGGNRPSDGFYLINEFRIKRKYQSYPLSFSNLYKRTNTKIRTALEQPIRYAGPGNWQVFEKPKPLRMYDRSGIIALPGAKENEKCLLVDFDLWNSFQDLSLWIEALCIHEWSIFTDHVEQASRNITRGMVYTLLTDRPDNRRPLTWERNQIDILLMEGHRFECPWSGRIIQNGVTYDLDHIIPVSLYPLNEMWNLVPSDPSFNSFKKRDKLPSPEALMQARPRLIRTYDNYFISKELSASITTDVSNRFLKTQKKRPDSRGITDMVTHYVNILAESRNIARFSI
ncbi:MAG TPA: HNH endonuclease domain-containing protein [Balneolales bacterium]|nr:HNH endonuclease domain-containing protein [Balneolales bacterium]